MFVLAPENGAREVLHEDASKLQPGAARMCLNGHRISLSFSSIQSGERILDRGTW